MLIYENALSSKDIWLIVGIAIVVVLLLVISIILLLVCNKKKKNKTVKVVNNVVVNQEELLSCLGGKDNVISHSLNGTRLSLTLKDQKLINKNKIKELGVERILEMSTKIILVGKDLNNINDKLD